MRRGAPAGAGKRATYPQVRTNTAQALRRLLRNAKNTSLRAGQAGQISPICPGLRRRL